MHKTSLIHGLTVALALGGCGPAGGTTGDTGTDPLLAPTVRSQTPAFDALDVALNAGPSATFDIGMDASTLNTTTFTLTSGATSIAGSVVYQDPTATFWPADHLAQDTVYTATVSTGAQSAAGVPLDEDYSWTFTTGREVAPGLPVRLGTAGNYVVLAKSAISTVPTSALTGDIGISPAAATFITGFSLTADDTNVFATSPQITGKVYAADYAVPTPSVLTTAVGDMELAFDDAAGRAPDVTELGAGNISGMTLEPGVYKWGTGLLLASDLTLSGGADEVWIFQIAQDLTFNTGVKVILTGGARPANVFWQVAGLVDLGTGAHAEGVVLTRTAVTLRTGATVNGRLLAQTAVALDASTLVQPTP